MDQTVLSIIIQLVSSVGFPIAVALWLLLRTDRTIQDLRDSVEALRNELLTTINRHDRGGIE